MRTLTFSTANSINAVLELEPLRGHVLRIDSIRTALTNTDLADPCTSQIVFSSGGLAEARIQGPSLDPSISGYLLASVNLPMNFDITSVGLAIWAYLMPLPFILWDAPMRITLFCDGASFTWGSTTVQVEDVPIVRR